MTAITTTLAAPCGPDDLQVLVSSALGITDQGINKTTPCYLLVDQSEYMLVDEGYVDGSLLVPVVRGFNGTIAQPHLLGAPVQISDEINGYGPPFFLPPE
jgi:hypothetical protein